MNAKDKYQYKRMRFFVVQESGLYIIRDAKHDNERIATFEHKQHAETRARWDNNYGQS